MPWMYSSTFSTSFSSAAIFLPAIFPAAVCKFPFISRNTPKPTSSTSATLQSNSESIPMISSVVSSP